MTGLKKLAGTAGEKFDAIVGIISPRAAYNRRCFRSAYEVLDKHRTRTKRTVTGGTGDALLDEHSLSQLREIARDLSRNNPIAVGLLRTECNSVIGTGPKIEARSEDDGFNKEAEAAFRETAINEPCDVTGRFNYSQVMKISYLSYRRDGDHFLGLTDEGLQLVEGEQVGTPWGKGQPENYDIINGVAYSRQTQRVIGYYIGKPDKWGYVRQESWINWPIEKVHHIFNPERSSFSRGEPILTPSIKYIDYLTGYIDAELVAAKVNACFSVFIKQVNPAVPDAYRLGVSAEGVDEKGTRYEKIDPGIVMYGRPGEEATGIGQTRPGTLFDPFVARILTIIGRPLCLPIMLITLDFSGATFMNARIAYQKAQENWQAEQEMVVSPLASRIWLWFMQKMVAMKKLKNQPADYLKHEVFCNRWPYVDPYKEAIADEQQLKNATTTRTAICARQGIDFTDNIEKLAAEKEKLEELGLTDVTEQTAGKIQVTN